MLQKIGMKLLITYIRNHLEAKILTILLAFLLCGFGTIYFLFSKSLEREFIAQVKEKSEMLASSIHQTLDRSMVNFRADIARHIIEDLKNIEGMSRIQIIRGKTGHGREEAFQDVKTLDDVKKRVPGGLRPEWVADHPDKTTNVAEGVDTPEFQAAFNKYLEDPHGEGIYYFEKIENRRVMTFLKPLPNLQRCFLCHDSDHKLRGVLMISTSIEKTFQDMQQSRRNLFMIALGTLLITGVLLKVTASRLVIHPLKSVSERIRDIAEGEGDLSKRLEVRSGDEIGRLASGFNLFAEKLSQLISKTRSTSEKVTSTSKEIMSGSREIMQGSDIQINATESTSISIEQMNSSVANVAESSEKLTTISKESAEAIQQMAIAMEEIAKNSTILKESVEETSSSILWMSSSVNQIDENVEALLTEADATSSSMSQMDRSLKEMRSYITETVGLSREVSEDAIGGKKTVEMTMEGMGRIREYSKEIFQVIRNLQKQTENIGKFLNVIDEVAEQTNLLALNAAIIAAQAGDRGKGFGVVANEMKELADRTAASTHEIHEIIKALQSEGKTAVEAIEIGNSRMEEGTLLSRSAHNALEKIVKSINRSREGVLLVSNMVEDQSKGVKQGATTMERVNQMVHQIAEATHEQSKGSGKIIDETRRMKLITQELQALVQDHSINMKKVNEVVEGVSRRVQEVADATLNQKSQSEEIIHSIEQIKKVTHENVNTVGNVGLAVEELMRQAKRLEEDLSRFKL